MDLLGLWGEETENPAKEQLCVYNNLYAKYGMDCIPQDTLQEPYVKTPAVHTNEGEGGRTRRDANHAVSEARFETPLESSMSPPGELR